MNTFRFYFSIKNKTYTEGDIDFIDIHPVDSSHSEFMACMPQFNKMVLHQKTEFGFAKLEDILIKKIEYIQDSFLAFEEFKNIPNGEIFATGIVTDNPEGINITNSGKELKCIAIKGDTGVDWSIYCHWADVDEEFIKRHGDQVTSEGNIRKLVPCTDEVFNLYRR